MPAAPPRRRSSRGRHQRRARPDRDRGARRAADVAAHGPPTPATAAAVRLQPASIAALDGCVGSSSTDAFGAVTTFVAANAYDGDPVTAWRCKGSPASGGAYGLVLTFDAPVEVRPIGAVPGYAKRDPRYAILDRFVQNNRVARAQWTCRTDAGRELSVAANYVDQPQMQTLAVQWSRGTTITFRATEARPGQAQDLPNPTWPAGRIRLHRGERAARVRLPLPLPLPVAVAAAVRVVRARTTRPCGTARLAVRCTHITGDRVVDLRCCGSGAGADERQGRPGAWR